MLNLEKFFKAGTPLNLDSPLIISLIIDETYPYDFLRRSGFSSMYKFLRIINIIFKVATIYLE